MGDRFYVSQAITRRACAFGAGYAFTLTRGSRDPIVSINGAAKLKYEFQGTEQGRNFQTCTKRCAAGGGEP